MMNPAGCGAVGSALRLGRRSRRFESDHPDHAIRSTDLRQLDNFLTDVLTPKDTMLESPWTM